MDHFEEELRQKIARKEKEVAKLHKHLEFHKEFLERKPNPEGVSDVHTAHCCEYHKCCKYGDHDCPVKTGAKRADYPCNCDW